MTIELLPLKQSKFRSTRLSVSSYAENLRYERLPEVFLFHILCATPLNPASHFLRSEFPSAPNPPRKDRRFCNLSYYIPASVRKIWALSVLSQVKFCSSLPKCP